VTYYNPAHPIAIDKKVPLFFMASSFIEVNQTIKAVDENMAKENFF
jgi:hypothetical protein